MYLDSEQYAHAYCLPFASIGEKKEKKRIRKKEEENELHGKRYSKTSDSKLN